MMFQKKIEVTTRKRLGVRAGVCVSAGSNWHGSLRLKAISPRHDV